MGATIVGSVILIGAFLGFCYATLGRIFRFHSPGRWYGGGEISLVGELSALVFIASVGAGICFEDSFGPVFFLTALPAWVVGFISQKRANCKNLEEIQTRREKNALRHPGIFDTAPPEDLDATPGDHVRLYDLDECTYLGVVLKSDLRPIIKFAKECLDGELNDLYFDENFFDILPETEFSDQFLVVVQPELHKRYSLILRWLPLENSA